MQQLDNELNNIHERFISFKQVNDNSLKYSSEGKDIIFQRNPSNPLSQEIMRAETKYDRMSEEIQLKKEILFSGEQLIDEIDAFRNSVIAALNNQREEIKDKQRKRNSLSETIIKMKQDLITISQEGVDELKKEINIFQEEIRVERYMMNKREMTALEQWTGCKCGDIIFDSDINDWHVDTCQFTKTLMNRSHIAIVIDDGNGNLFGGYVEAIIKSMWHTDNMSLNANNASRTVDPNAFVFSIKRDGKEHFAKYQSIDQSQSFILHDEKCGRLIHFGFLVIDNYGYCDIDIMRKPYHKSSKCEKGTYD